MVDRIACFITCGYTEAGALQAFLRKINSRYEYKQYLPNKTIKRKGMPKNIDSSISGLTGEALLEKVYSIVEKLKDEIGQCKAIVIEDDLDGRFANLSVSEIEEKKRKVVDKLHSLLGKELPVFLLYASPEVESWFVADWKNGFEYLYCKGINVDDVETNAKLFFTHHLRQYINKNLLKEYSERIEEYGFFEGKYFKLSDQIIEAIQTGVKEYLQVLPGTNKEYVRQIVESRSLHYSKKLHGNRMLNNILPQVVALQCRTYFFPIYNELSSFSA